MTDLDDLERRLEQRAIAYYGGAADAYGEALRIVREMRAEALPDADDPSVPPMNHAPTTQATREAMLPRSGTLRRAMVDDLRVAPLGGYTDDELEARFGRAHQTISAARHGLVQQGWVRAQHRDGAAVQRPTRAGNAAQVWELSPAARLRLAAGR